MVVMYQPAAGSIVKIVWRSELLSGNFDCKYCAAFKLAKSRSFSFENNYTLQPPLNSSFFLTMSYEFNFNLPILYHLMI